MLPRVLYLHGFASSRDSKKGVAVADHLAPRGIAVDRLDLRAPSLERLDFAAMLARAHAALGGERDRALVIGSSLGGLTAARLAERDARVFGLVLLAPAFGFAERWRERLGEQEWLDVHDHATGRPTQVHGEFVRTVLAYDRDDGGYPDVRVPTLILHGFHDDVVPVEASRRFAADRANARLVELDDGHDLVASLPSILRAIEDFAAPAFGGAVSSS